jgi:hypothetical protein
MGRRTRPSWKKDGRVDRLPAVCSKNLSGDNLDDRQRQVHAAGNSPSRLAMILSTMRLGSIVVIRCRIGSGVIW